MEAVVFFSVLTKYPCLTLLRSWRFLFPTATVVMDADLSENMEHRFLISSERPMKEMQRHCIELQKQVEQRLARK